MQNIHYNNEGGDFVVDHNVTNYFNKIYYETYKKVFGYVTVKCSDTNDVSDILQDTYSEVYSVLIKKGTGYIDNYEAFVLRVAKTKVFKHYNLKEKMKHIIPLFSNADDKEVCIIDFELTKEISLEDNLINNDLLSKIGDYISEKPQLTQKVFYLYYYCEYTIPEIAKELCVGESNVKNRLYRTVKEVRQYYGKDGAHCE